MELKRINLSQLALVREVPRAHPLQAQLERLVAEFGIIHPVIVRKLADKLYEVIDGEVRVHLLKGLYDRKRVAGDKLGVPSLIVEAPTERERAMWRLVSNVHSALPQDEIDFLTAALGADAPAFKGERKVVLGNGRRSSTDLNTLLQAISVRRSGIRSSQRIMNILETARDFTLGEIELIDAVDRVRWSEGDE